MEKAKTFCLSEKSSMSTEEDLMGLFLFPPRVPGVELQRTSSSKHSTALSNKQLFCQSE